MPAPALTWRRLSRRSASGRYLDLRSGMSCPRRIAVMESYLRQHDLPTTASHLNRAGRQLVPLLRALPAPMRRTCADLATSLAETAEKRGLAGPGLGVSRQIDTLIAGRDHACVASRFAILSLLSPAQHTGSCGTWRCDSLIISSPRIRRPSAEEAEEHDAEAASRVSVGRPSARAATIARSSRGHRRGASLVALADQQERQFGAGLGERHEPSSLMTCVTNVGSPRPPRPATPCSRGSTRSGTMRLPSCPGSKPSVTR